MVRQRVRIRFRKQQELRLISHRDLVRMLERLFRRAGLCLSMSEGFHPKPRMSFPLALAVGITGLDEVLELELAAHMTSQEVEQALTPHLPSGLAINHVEVLPEGAKKAQVRQVTFETGIPTELRGDVTLRIQELLASAMHRVEREEDRGSVDIRSYLEQVSLDGDTLRFQVRVTPLGTARPREILQALGLEDLESRGFLLTRTTVELEGAA